ncbi:unnamed protein product [Camellia sinensis]
MNKEGGLSMVSSSPKASSKEMEGNALIGVDKLPKKIYKTLDESTKILRYKVPFSMFAYLIYLDSKGKEVDLSTYKGKVLLVVNVASKCYSKLLSNLSKMRHLDLSYNNFDEDAFRILGALPSLKFLSLVSNSMEGPLSNQGNLLNGTLPIIPPSIGALSSLKALSLAQNNLSGSLLIQGMVLTLAEMKILRRKMEELGIDSNICKPGQYNHLSCPMCKGGDSEEKSLFIFITANGIQLCGPVFKQNVAGEAYVNGNSTFGRIAHISKVKQTREITEKSLDLEPTCSEDPRLLGEIHVVLLRSVIKDIEDVARTPSSTGLGAALKGDWKAANGVIEIFPTVIRSSITKRWETALHIAVAAKRIHFVEELVGLMNPEDLELQNSNGNTALCFVVTNGTVRIAEVVINKNEHVPMIRGSQGMTPLYMASLLGHSDMV